jgi:hypothetical protein
MPYQTLTWLVSDDFSSPLFSCSKKLDSGPFAVADNQDGEKAELKESLLRENKLFSDNIRNPLIWHRLLGPLTLLFAPRFTNCEFPIEQPILLVQRAILFLYN